MKINYKFLTSAWLPYAVLIMYGFLLYSQSLFFQLTYLDDNVWILDYHWYLKELKHIPKLFIEPDNFISDIFYRPLIILTFITDAVLGGKEPFVYHLTNIIIHIINACFVFTLFKKLDYGKVVAFCAGAVFLSHPVLAQAVVWIPGRTDSLLCLFALPSFIAYVNYLKTRRLRHLISHFLLFVCALLTKETAIVMPAVFFLFYILIERKERGSLKQKPVMVGWIVVTVLWFVVRKIILKDAPGLKLMVAFKSVIANLPTFLVYLGKIIFPVNLSVLPIMEDATFVFGIIVLMLLIAGFFFSKTKRVNHIIFGGFWFMIFILPSLVISFLIHDYRVYLPMVGFMILFCEIIDVKTLVEKRKKFFMAAAAVVLVFSVTTIVYSRQFKDRYTFWENAVKASPHAPLAHRNLGAMYHLDGKLGPAELAYLKALEINDKEFMVNNNLGLIAARRGKIAEAEKYYLREIAINPTYENVYYNLGLLYYATGRQEKASNVWKQTIKLNPRFLMAYKYLLQYYSSIGDKKQTAYYIDELEKMGVTVSSK